MLKQDFLSPATLTRPAITTAVGLINHDSKLWPRTGSGIAKLYGTTWVAVTTQDLLEVAGSSLTGQEVRYISCPCKGFFPRARHAMLQSFLTYDRNGRWSFAISRVAAYYGAAAVAVYGLYPEAARTPGRFATFGTSQIYFGSGAALLQEFLPELTRPLRRKKP
jgi:hypothetical protein